MLILMLACGFAALAHRYLQTYAPSNAVVARVRRERPRFRLAAGLAALSTTLVTGAFLLAEWVANGGPAWLNLVVLITIWDAFKFTFLAFAVSLRSAIATLRRATGGPLVVQAESGRSARHRGLP